MRANDFEPCLRLENFSPGGGEKTMNLGRSGVDCDAKFDNLFTESETKSR